LLEVIERLGGMPVPPRELVRECEMTVDQLIHQRILATLRAGASVVRVARPAYAAAAAANLG
jgi:hypothetical protein